MIFSNIIGNEQAKSKLRFFIDGYNLNGFLPPLILSGARGNGKTMFSKEIGRNLINKETEKPKKFLEINGIELQKKGHFFDNIVIPHMQNEPCTIFIDEAHALGIDIFTMFLQILSPNENHFNTYMYDGVNYDFDLSVHSFIFASSEPQKLLDTFMDRLEHVEISDYKIPELAQILKKHLKDIKVDNNLLTSIAEVTRGNARGAQKLSSHISQYIKSLNKIDFETIHWEDIRNKLSINPLGLSELEIKILKTLKQYPNISLTKVAAITGLGRDAIRLSYETFLLKNNFMTIQPGLGRSLTDFGHKYLDTLKVEV